MKAGKHYVLKIENGETWFFRKGMKFIKEDGSFCVFYNTIRQCEESIPIQKILGVEESV